MLSKALQPILHRYLGQFITGLENVELTLWQGKINSQNAAFKHQKINELLKLHNVPLSIKYSFLGSLEINIPWNKLTTAPVQIKLSNVVIVFKLEKVIANLQEVEDLKQNAKFILIKNYLAFLLKKSQEAKDEQEGSSGFLKKMLIKILHNLNLEVSNIHIRIENNNNTIIQSDIGDDEFVDCKDESEAENLGFALGFCIESIEAHTINAQNVKEFVKVENDKTEIRKRINLRQISVYWEENSAVNLFELSQERKIDFLKKIIDRKQHRLLTIDGQILMEKGKENYDYFFSTSFRLLEIGLNYEQLKQFLEVYQQFMNAKAKKKITKMKEIDYSQQLGLQIQFKQLFKRLQSNNFTEVGKQDISLMDCIDKKLLMKWTKEETIELIKKSKFKQAFENKNKRTWLGFISKNVQNQLTEDDISAIQKQISKLLLIIEEESFGKTIGFYLHFNLLRLIMDNHRVQQQLLFLAQNIQVQFEGKKGELVASLEIADVALTYSDLANKSQVSIFKNNREEGAQKYFSLRVEDSQKIRKVDIGITSMKFTHEIQFLSFLAELIKLRERERIKGEMVLINPQLKIQQVQSNKLQEEKLYECNINMKQLQIMIELSKAASLYVYIDGINVEKTSQVNSHKAKIVNFGIAYLQKGGEIDKSYNILDDLNIEVALSSGLKMVQSSIPRLRITLNEESLYYIVHCMKDQYSILKIRSKATTNEVIAEQKYMQGETSTISVFKAVNVYHSVLTNEYLYFYEKDNAKINYDKVIKRLLLRNLKVSRIDDHSFKLQSVMVNEIVSCKEKEETERWIYQIEQRIFENSTKMQMFDMMEEGQIEGSPLIFIPYDSIIQMQVRKIEIVYEKNESEKILGVELSKLKVHLKENNLQFQRKIDLDEIKLVDLSLTQEKRDEYNLILSNTHNYFEDPDEDEEPKSNIEVLIEGKKKTHPKYTGEVTIKSRVNKLFINFNAELVFSILYRLVVGEASERYYSEQAKFTKIFEYLQQILAEKNGIQEKYAFAKDFQFDRSYVQLDKYKQIYSCLVLFHVEIKCEEVEVYLINGRNFHWMDKFIGYGLSFQIDKGVDFLFIKGASSSINLSDVTGYPKTIQKPFTQQQPYPIIKPRLNRKFKNMVDFQVGVFQPLTFINKQRFKNYFMLNLYDADINYQQQPLLRFVDFLTNQIILFIIEPFSLHKFDTPNRGPYQFGYVNFTEEEVQKILYESVYPCFTHLNINGFNLTAHFNSHPHDEAISMEIARVSFTSAPQLNPQRIHVRLDEFRRFQSKYPLLRELLQNQSEFQQKISKSQWITRYLITAEGCQCEIIQNEFNYEMYFQRSNNGDKDILLPFLVIQKDLLMQGRIKNLSINAPKKTYNLINKCFIFNLSHDDQSDILFNTNQEFQSYNIPSKLIYRLFVNELSIVIPEIKKTVIIIQNCEYKFLKYEDARKEMEVNGKSLHILGSEENIIVPLNLDQEREKGIQYAITMKPSGEKKMSAFIRQIDFHYHQEVIFPLFKYFLLDESCYPKQDVYTDLPLIICEVYLLNSYIKLIQNADHVYALKGDIKVNWNRYQQPHPQTYKVDKQFYPKDKDGSSYDIEFKGVAFRKYNKKTYMNLSSIKEGTFYRSLSSSMVFNVTLTNVMKIQNEITYTDMVGSYEISSLCLKLSYKDYQEIMSSFKKDEPVQDQAPPIAELGYTPYSKHKVLIGKLSLQLGLSELPVPLLDICLQRSQIDIELIGKTNVLTSKIELNVNYWNMMIGKWQPLVQKSYSEITLKAGQFQKYLMATSNKALLLNFSVQSLKVLKLLAKDVEEEGNLHVINKQERAKGIQISPYVITNRTGYSIIIHSDFTLTAKLKNNEKMHLQNRSLELDESFSSVNYQIEGDGTLYDLNLNVNQIQKPIVTFNDQKYRLIISAIATPILKEIVISSPYVIHNKTKYALVLTLGQREYQVDAQSKVPIPFTEQIHENKSMHLQFVHLNRVTENFNFQFRDIYKGYEHYIIYEDSETFNCLISIETLSENVITISPLITFINLLPLDLLMELALTKINKDKTVLNEQLEVNRQKLFYEFGSKDEVFLRIRIKGFNFSEFINVNLSNDKDRKELNNDIIFVDCRGQPAAIRNKIIKKNKQKFIYIYADSVLINETDYKFFIFDETQLLAGQRLKDIVESDSKYIFLGKVENPSICFSEEDPSQAKKFTTKGLGELIKVTNHTLLHEMVINNSINCLCEEAQIFTSIVKVTPRFILVNKCRRELAFRQVNTDQRFILPIGQRRDWYWHHYDEARLITVTAFDSEFELPNGWDYSSPLSLQILEETILVIRPKDKNPDRLLLKTQIFKQSQQMYVVFKELVEKQDSLIKIQNNVKLVNLEIYQQALTNNNQPWIQYKHFTCPSLKEIDFGWDYPEEEHKVVVAFQFIGPYRSKFNNDITTLNLDKMNKPQIIQFKGDNDELLVIEVSIEIVGLRRTIIFRNRDESMASHYSDDDLLLQMSGNKIGISFAMIGISIIGGKGRRSQIVFMSIKKLDLIMTEKQMKRNYELKIKYINIDNNLNHNTMYPVLFTPLKEKKTLQKSRPFFICLVEQNLKTKQIVEINYFRLCIEPISFKIYDEMLTRLYDFQTAFNNVEEKKDVNVGILFRSRNAEYEWQGRSIIKEGASTFIREIEIGKVIVELSFSIRPTFSGNIIIHTILSLFKTALSNVSESQMRLNRFLCKNLSLGDLKNQLSEFYRRQVFKEAYKIAGSINLFGNPYVFVKYLAEGTWEIVNQPSEGFIKGPIEGAIGIGKGGVYFLRNVIAGTFNSFEVISESCSRGLASITYDEKFITRREKIQMQKSKQFVQGTKSALWALFTGFEVAITGIVRHPTEERKKIGTAGIFKGLAIGLAGLITKPMSGLFEAISKFSEGVKQTALFYQDGPNITRSRPPRVFISDQQYYTDYNMQESKAINLLEFHSTKHLQKTILLVAVDEQLKDQIYTVVTSEYLVQLSKKNTKIIKEVKLADINEVQSLEMGGRRGVRIRYNDDEVVIMTQKHRELYECFKEIFTKIEDEFEDEDYYEE